MRFGVGQGCLTCVNDVKGVLVYVMLRECSEYVDEWCPILVGVCGAVCPVVGVCGAVFPVLVGVCGAVCPVVGVCGAVCPVVGVCGAVSPVVGVCGSVSPVVGVCGVCMSYACATYLVRKHIRNFFVEA